METSGLAKPNGIRFAIILAPFLSIVFAACEQDFELQTIGDPVPVVYCLLNPGSEAQYVRVGRTYSGGSSARELAPVEDSLIWNLPYEVYLEELDNGLPVRLLRFNPDSGIPKDSGFFPAPALRLFRSDFRPKSLTQYRLYVYYPDLDKMVSGLTWVHDSPEILDPSPIPGRTITFEPDQPFKARWYPGEKSGLYQTVFRIHYTDSTNGNIEFKRFDYESEVIYNLKDDQMLDQIMGGARFFQTVASEVPALPEVVREVISAEFILHSGGTDLAFLFKTSSETGSDFSGLNEYSNLTNGVGIFSSLGKSTVTNLRLSNLTLDHLAQNTLTAHLGFKDSKGRF